MKNNHKFLKTTDISLISTAYSLGIYPEKIDRSNPNKVVFWLREDIRIKNIIKNFYEHKLLVDPLSLLNSFKELKSQIYHI